MVYGSSPRMWETRPHMTPPYLSTRFIPTHVGNTRGAADAADWAAVHPHACGKHKSQVTNSCFFRGSSPRMWETLARRHAELNNPRFIPTHVGNTTAPTLYFINTAVHPHACGKHVGFLTTPISKYGSSPRMWETHETVRYRPMTVRFIPTHVGNTAIALFQASAIPVHPHACGKHDENIY